MTKTLKAPYKKLNLPIHTWAEADRPREKLLLKGRHNLTDAELLAIIIGSGSVQESALDLAKRILASVDNNLLELGKRSITQLKGFHGIGQAKAISISAALELSRRRSNTASKERPQVKSSFDAYNILSPLIRDLPHEECWLLALNHANYLLKRIRISSGGLAATVVDMKVVFGQALAHNASAIVLAHNHPSGQLKASTSDIELTQKLVKAGKNLELPVLDHLIISEKGYLSLADEGLMS